MKTKKLTKLLLSIFFFAHPLWADELEIPAAVFGNEKLVLIKAVDEQKKTFIASVGYHDEISPHQESLFTNENISLRARAIEVSRNHSLWELRDRRATLPFEAQESVIFSYQLKNVWGEVTRAIAFEKLQTQREQRQWSKEEYFSTRFSLSYGVAESITETSADQQGTRGGQQVEVLYHRPFLQNIDMGFGIRLDFEKLIQENPSLEIPTNRYLGMFELSYHFPSFLNGDFIYVGAAAGYGLSRTDVSGDVNDGDAWVLPLVKLGYAKMIGSNRAFLIELVGESITANEVTVIDSDQRTTIINAKLSVGLRF